MEVWAGVVMAAGSGTRMKSKIPKVLHKVCGREMVVYPVEALRQAGIAPIVVVVSPGNEEGVRSLLGDSVQYVVQSQPQGTGHALLQAAPLLDGKAAHVLALNADLPLVRTSSLQSLRSHHLSVESHITLLSATNCSYEGMASIVRDDAGSVMDVVEAKERGGVNGTSSFKTIGELTAAHIASKRRGSGTGYPGSTAPPRGNITLPPWSPWRPPKGSGWKH